MSEAEDLAEKLLDAIVGNMNCDHGRPLWRLCDECIAIYGMPRELGYSQSHWRKLEKERLKRESNSGASK